MKRRTLLALPVAATAVTVLGSGKAWAATYPLVPAKPADVLRQTFGINTHTTWKASPYAATVEGRARVQELVKQLGASWWREHASTSHPYQPPAARGFAAFDCRQLAIIGTPGSTTVELQAAVDGLFTTYGADLPHIVRAVSGVNEPNDSGWSPGDVAAKQKTIYQAVRGNKAFDGIPVISPSIKGQLTQFTNDMGTMTQTDVANWCDYGDVHYYPGTARPGTLLTERLNVIESTYHKPPVCTENGYATPAIPDSVAAWYAPRLLLEMVSRGVSASLDYELLDQPNLWDSTYRGRFGLVSSPTNDPTTWMPRPSFNALARLIAVTRDDGPTFTPTGLEMTLTGTGVKSMLLGRRDGSHILLLWRDVTSYNTSTHKVITVAPVTATMSFPVAHNITSTDISSGAVTTVAGVSTFEVGVASQALAVSIT